MKTKRLFHCAIATLGVAVLLSVLTGCEDGSGANPLTISPDVVSLQGSNAPNSVVFTVSSNSLRTLSFPLMWSVSRPELGVITSASGASAVYLPRNLAGVNIISVRDQYEEEGFATVYQ